MILWIRQIVLLKDELRVVEMEGDAEAQEDQKVSFEAIIEDTSACGSPRATPTISVPGHRRCQSEITITHRRSDSFQKLKVHVQKAWRRGAFGGEQGPSSSFNLEVLANQKRQWYQLHSKTLVYLFCK